MAKKGQDEDKIRHDMCQRQIRASFEGSHLVASMEKKGCDVTPEFYQCRPCALPIEGLYDSKLGVVLCENNVAPPQIREVMLHETFHAYDYCRAKIDDSDCNHIACTEIRANNLSGQCAWSNEIKRGHYAIRRQHRECVKRRAMLTLESIPHCRGKSKEAVDRVFDRCYADKEPFGFTPDL